jgi:hypothetical protein
MKNVILSIILIAGITGIAAAQNIRFNGYAEYIFDDNVDSYYSNTDYYEGTIKGGFQWGGGLEFMVDETKGIELKYLRRDAIAPTEFYNNGINFKDFELAMNYILLGGTNYFQTGGKVEPYAGLAAGVGIFTIKNAEAASDNTATTFTWTIKLGTNIWLSEKVGLKLQADLLSAVQSMGGGLYFGTGGAGAGVSTYSTMYQWGLGGGLVFKLGQ